MPQHGRDFVRWQAGSSDDAAVAAWRHWVAQATGIFLSVC